MPRIIFMTNSKLKRLQIYCANTDSIYNSNQGQYSAVILLRGFNIINSYTWADPTAALLNGQTPQSFSCNTANADNTDLWFLHRPTHKQ